MEVLSQKLDACVAKLVGRCWGWPRPELMFRQDQLIDKEIEARSADPRLDKLVGLVEAVEMQNLQSRTPEPLSAKVNILVALFFLPGTFVAVCETSLPVSGEVHGFGGR